MTVTGETVEELPSVSSVLSGDLLYLVRDGVDHKLPGSALLTGAALTGIIDVVRDFHADPTGGDLSDDAFEDFVAACTTSGDPAVAVLQAVVVGWIPGGTYRLSRPWLLRSILGATIIGAGSEQVTLRFEGALDVGVDLTGAAFSRLGGFTISSTADAAIQIAFKTWWDQVPGDPGQAARSTSCNHYFDIVVLGCRYVRGIQVGNDGDNNQDDNDTWDRVKVFGSTEFPWDDVGHPDHGFYEEGIKVGSGVFANNLLHTMVGCIAHGNKWNVHLAATELLWLGGAFGYGEVDVYTDAVSSYLKVEGLRSEWSKRFVQSTGGVGYPALATFAEIEWISNNIHADGQWIDWNRPGNLRLNNVDENSGDVPHGTDPTVHLAPTGGYGLTVEVEGITTQTAIENTFDIGGGSNVAVYVKGHTQFDNVAGTVAHTHEWQRVPAGASPPEYMEASRFNPIVGSPALVPAATYWQGMAFDAAADEYATATVQVPGGWTALDLTVEWVNGGGGSGNVEWIVQLLRRAPGQDLALGGGPNPSGGGDFAAGAANIVVASLAGTALPVVGGEVIDVLIIRTGSSVGDTLPNDAVMLGVRLTAA